MAVKGTATSISVCTDVEFSSETLQVVQQLIDCDTLQVTPADI